MFCDSGFSLDNYFTSFFKIMVRSLVARMGKVTAHSFQFSMDIQ